MEEAVASGSIRVDVELGSVAFCDCSCLNVLLAARSRALLGGVTLACVAFSPCAERVLELTEVGPLLRTAR